MKVEKLRNLLAEMHPDADVVAWTDTGPYDITHATEGCIHNPDGSVAERTIVLTTQKVPTDEESQHEG